jgi:hypothetical protein
MVAHQAEVNRVDREVDETGSIGEEGRGSRPSDLEIAGTIYGRVPDR